MLGPDQILALSPDDSSAKAAKGLLAPAKWPTLGHNNAAIWGECQGSGSKPYQVIIDVTGPSFKCTCPSRKFPCKHGLALYLLLTQKESAFTSNEPPPWVKEWLGVRQQRAEKQAEKKTAEAEGKAEAPADPAAVARREARRLDRMTVGARDLERWMGDLVRHGMADLPAKPAVFWRETAARLVDAQATGLAAGVRHLEGAVSSGDGWQQRTLLHMGRLQLLMEAMQRLDTLPPPLQYEVRASAGWTADKEEVIAAGDRVEDVWHVLGVSHEENEKLWERRVWLQSARSRRQALLLDFSHGARRFDQGFVSGTKVKATLAFFPGASALRALMTDGPQATETQMQMEPVHSWDKALESVAGTLAKNPWQQRFPVTLHHATPALRDDRWFARDADSREAPLRVSDDSGWQLLALSGGHPLAIFGEWFGDHWRPLTVWLADQATPCWTEVTAPS
jgi:hypothetical protein